MEKIEPNEQKIENVVKPISKNQMKKIKRQEEWDKKKQQMRKNHRERKKQKNKEKQKNNPEPNEIDKALLIPRKERQAKYIEQSNKGIIILIDCGFEHLMNEKDIISLSRQVTDCYSTNKKSTHPFNLIVYDVGDMLLSCLKKNNYENWVGFKLVKQGEYKSITDYIQSIVKQDEGNADDISQRIVYLSADSNNEINELKQNEVYIIGGIVDRNKHKLLCFNKAKEIGINHGKLPIGEYIDLKSSKVLTTNHVFSILGHFNDNGTKDWKEAFLSIIPKRKIDEDNK